MREQRGYVFHRGKSWFVRYCDDVRQSDGSIKRALVCKKLAAPFGDQYRSEKSVRLFVDDILGPSTVGRSIRRARCRLWSLLRKFTSRMLRNIFGEVLSKATGICGQIIFGTDLERQVCETFAQFQVSSCLPTLLGNRSSAAIL